MLLYKEVNLALGINSFYSKQKLVEQHPENIKVIYIQSVVNAEGRYKWHLQEYYIH